MDISSRLIVNQAALKLKRELLAPILEAIAGVVAAMIGIKRLTSSDRDFRARLDALLAFEATQDESVEGTVARILADVKARGDAAVIEYTRRFDGLSVSSMAELELSQNELQQALAGLPSDAATGARGRCRPRAQLPRAADTAELAV
jgi:hypothetical protein